MEAIWHYASQTCILKLTCKHSMGLLLSQSSTLHTPFKTAEKSLQYSTEFQ